jgi:hypothetical protein
MGWLDGNAGILCPAPAIAFAVGFSFRAALAAESGSDNPVRN